MEEEKPCKKVGTISLKTTKEKQRTMECPEKERRVIF